MSKGVALNEHCQCGGTFTGSGIPIHTRDQIAHIWWDGHQGDGHGRCDAETARQARRRAEDTAVRAGKGGGE